MACDTCSHTMQNLGVEGQRIFWCPRCGSLKTVVGHADKEFTNTERPKLVDIAREFVRRFPDTDAGRQLKQQAEASGILESTLPPGDR